MKNMIRLSLLTFMLALLVGLVPSVSRAADNDARGPACADIFGGQFRYTSTATPGVFNLTARMLLGPAGTTEPCRNITYTLYVIVDGTDEAAALAFPQTGSRDFVGLTIEDDDRNICVFGTTSIGTHVFDRAPDEGCLVVTADLTPAPGGWN